MIYLVMAQNGAVDDDQAIATVLIEAVIKIRNRNTNI